MQLLLIPVTAIIHPNRPTHLPPWPLPHVIHSQSHQDVSHQELVRALRVDAAKEGSKARQEFELVARELQLKYEKKMKLQRDELELRRKHELHEVGAEGRREEGEG